MQDKFCIHCKVRGKVQGVWFRASTQKEAIKRDLKGWVRNLPDGSVEVIACGEKAKVLELYAWLKLGPPAAEVKNVTYEESPWQEYAQFVIV